MVSAADQNHCDLRDFSAFGNDPWPMTAELIKMAQYYSLHFPSALMGVC